MVTTTALSLDSLFTPCRPCTLTTTALSLDSLFTPCRPCTLDRMSVCPLLSSLSLSRKQRQRTDDLSVYILTCIWDYASQIPFLRCCQSLWQWATESRQHFVFCAALDWSTVQWPAVTFIRETFSRVSVLLHFRRRGSTSRLTNKVRQPSWVARRRRLISTVVVVCCSQPPSSHNIYRLHHLQLSSSLDIYRRRRLL